MAKREHDKLRCLNISQDNPAMLISNRCSFLK